MIQEVATVEEMIGFGARIGALLRGGEMIELVGDVGAGKTTLVKGIAKGLAIDEDIQSPSFTISRVYEGRDGLRLAHYDFYRLQDSGIMADELSEAVADQHTVVIVEWADVAKGVLPEDKMTIELTPITETSRKLQLNAGGVQSETLVRGLAL